jgi:phosphoglycolate phosphatase-like HAD superfamily hydrolase
MYLILFDIDGTLVLTGRAGWRAMNRACADIVGHDNAMAGVEFAGRTDWSILADVMRNHGKTLDSALLDRLNRSYVAHLAEEIELPGTGVKDVMPGIRPLLDALQQRDDVALGLLTGNFIDGARIKLGYFDLWKYFPCGAFGGDSANRNDLVPVAVRRAAEAGIAGIEAHRVIVVGDTPNDVECARVAGALPVAVATGSYTVDDLRATGAEIVFQDLSNTQAFLKLLDSPA